MQSAGHWGPVSARGWGNQKPSIEMSQRVILVTGGNGGLGDGIARCFVQESPDNSVWLGVRKNRSQADRLAAEFPNRCHCEDVDVTQHNARRAALHAGLGGHK